GANGSGKTLLLRAIAGLAKPSRGRVEREPGRVAYLPQNPSAVLHRPTLENEVAYTLRRAGEDGSPLEILSHLGLAQHLNRYPRDLSGGERQRAALAAILAGRPLLAILDEPTRGMDMLARVALRDLLYSLAAGGTAVVLATHDAELVAAVASIVVEVAAGTARLLGHPRLALSGGGALRTQVGCLYPGAAATVDDVLHALVPRHEGAVG
ncbi:MAG: ATP-binding cassette domain-containing protein, partial [Candidatus Dormibacteria bacterium]